MQKYQDFIKNKTQIRTNGGFEPLWMPDCLFNFQKYLTEWVIRRGRGATFADCGLGKTFLQLVFAENIARKTGKPVLILTPLAVAFQTVAEGHKLGLDVVHRREGRRPGDSLIVTNYERLHYFDRDDYAGVIGDESSAIKDFKSVRRQRVTEFMRTVRYRGLYTATAAPNDYPELGTSSEALGEMGVRDMESRFFKRDEKFCRLNNMGGEKLTFRGHAEEYFWRWVCSWARTVRQPSDLGFDNTGFELPPLQINEHRVTARRKADGFLFDLPAITKQEQTEELRRTLHERCEMAASLITSHGRPAVAWCHLNDEGHLLKKLIPGAVEVEGSDSDEAKEEAFRAFAAGDIRVIVSKPSIAGFGLNWQHCAHMTYFPSDSYERYYQAMRRLWRFGQKYPVTVDCITTDGQQAVMQNMQRKAANADKMFSKLTSLMQHELNITRQNEYTKQEALPSWL